MNSKNVNIGKTGFCIISVGLFVIAVGLRWFRLDLMTFRYDQAAVAFRSVEALKNGIPLTGIINSLGFHNGPGYIWTVFPAFLLSPDPRFAVAWHGLLASTIVFPLALTGRQFGRKWLIWIPPVLAAVLPEAVFAGRNLWAQNLLPACAGWALWALCLSSRTDLQSETRLKYSALAMGIMAWATSIHFSAGLLLAVTFGFVTTIFRRNIKQLIIAALPALVICLTLIPSGLDWYDKSRNPAPKPAFVLEYEQVLPPPLPWWMRIQDSLSSLYYVNSLDAVPGIDRNIGKVDRTGSRGLDCFAMALILCGWGVLFYQFFKGSRSSSQRNFQVLLLTWLLIPVVIAPLVVSRINLSYFMAGLPALWMMPLFLQKIKDRVWIGVAVILLIGSTALNSRFLAQIQKSQFVNGPYYIPYQRQVDLIRYVSDNGVKPGQFLHLSGDWFQLSYDYILKHVASPSNSGSTFAVIEDQNLRTDEPIRMQYFLDQKPVKFEKVGAILFSGRGQAEIFARNYYDIGER